MLIVGAGIGGLCLALALRKHCGLSGEDIEVFEQATAFTNNAFGTFYTFGNIVALCSTMFLMGPKRQLRNMTRANRRMATGVYIVAMIVTLSLAFTGAPGIVVIISCLFRARATTGRPNARTSSLSLWRSARRAPSWPVPI